MTSLVFLFFPDLVNRRADLLIQPQDVVEATECIAIQSLHLMFPQRHDLDLVGSLLLYQPLQTLKGRIKNELFKFQK